MNVTKVSPWEKDGKTRYYITFGDGSEAVCFSEQAAALEIGADLPDGWVLEPPKQDGWKPMLKAPKKAGGGGFGGGRPPRWIDTEEGARWQDERINRRRALELASQSIQASTIIEHERTRDERVIAVAGTYYDFLNAGAVPAVPARQPSAGGSPAAVSPGGGADREGAGGGQPRGEVAPVSKPPRSTERPKYDPDAWAGMPGMNG